MQNILIILFVTFHSLSTFCQHQNRVQHLDSILQGVDFVVLGESHWIQEETVVYQKEVITNFYKQGHRDIIVYIEASPTMAYFLQKHVDSNDSIFPFSDPALHLNRALFNFYLQSIKDSINITIEGIDVEKRARKYHVWRFFNSVLDVTLLHTEWDILSPLTKKSSSRKLRKTCTKILQNSDLMNLIESSMTKEDFKYFKNEILVISKIGFKGGILKNKRKIRIRDEWMAKSIISNKNDNAKLLTIGRGHIEFKHNEVLKIAIDSVSSKHLIAPIVYENKIYIVIGHKVYNGYEELQELVNNGGYELILSPIGIIFPNPNSKDK